MATHPSTSGSPGQAKRKPRTLILCFDGTGNEYTTANTNVVKLYSIFRKDKVEDQVCYYQAGIGTYFAPGVVQPAFRWIAKLLDEGFAWYLSEHVTEGYKFLMQNYNYGDKVCIFGFSRGAYTARALAGMLHKVGLLSKDNVEQVPFAYKLYKSSGKKKDALARGFKATFCRNVPIDFVGVWDTVASVGIITGRSLPFADVNTTIRVFRQALSLDEHRAKFRPNMYQVTPPGSSSKKPKPDVVHPGTDEIFKELDVKEVWFSGCHSDVGGGQAQDKAPHSLSDISLRWMIEQVVSAECQILFDWDQFERWHIPRATALYKDPSPPKGESATSDDAPPGDGDEREAQDAIQKITDQLKINPLWWIVEILPLPYTYRNEHGKWVTTWWPNCFRGRWVPPDPKFHESVKIRERDPKLKYKPKARYHKGTEIYVE